MNHTPLCDYHLHTSFSADSDAPMEAVIASGIEKGASVLCFTEHTDIDFPPQYELDFTVDMPAYQQTYERLRDAYASQVELRWGIELGLQPHLPRELSEFVSRYPFDFVIGSSHIIDRLDPYHDDYWEGRSEAAAFTRYFQSILENLAVFSDFDVYGHIDYVIRYSPNQNRNYRCADYWDLLDEILKTLLHKGIGIELNTGGFKYGLGHPNPCEEVLRRYRQLGGEIITLGSDAHTPDYVLYEFPRSLEILRECGFRYYTVFRERKPEFLPL